MSAHLLTILLVSPFAGAAAILFLPVAARRAIRLTALASALPPLAATVALFLGYDGAAGGFQFREVWPVLSSIGIDLRLGVDGIGLALVALTSIIYFTAITTSWRVNEREKEYFLFLALLVTGVFGVFISLDLFLFFMFYELAVLPMYVLIGIWGSSMEVRAEGPFAKAFRAVGVGSKEYGAMKLTLYLLAGSAFILVGLFLLYVESGKLLPQSTFDFQALSALDLDPVLQSTVFLLFYVGFGVLAGIWPFHTWSPDGHAAAPAAGSMMHAGVLMKLGAYGVLRLGFQLLPEAAQEWAWLVGLVAAINIVYGAIAAGWQTDIKYLIAYSSVSHMGVVMLGMATLTEPGLSGSVFQMVAHGLMTALFFTLVNLVYHKAHERNMTKMGGFADAMPGMAAFFVIAGLSSLGLPGLAGFVAEFLVFLGTWTSDHPWWLLPALAGAFITALYVLRAVRVIFYGPKPSHEVHLHDLEGSEWWTPVVLAAMLLLLGVWPRLMLDPIHVGVGEILARFGGGL
jgi:NADH-quinone oxidoreductase subunit M